MENTVSRGSKLPIANIGDLKEMGKMIAQSGFIGKINPAQGFVIACILHQTGQSINEFIETYHLVGSSISMRADTMVANLLKLGGEYKINERSGDKAEVWMKYRTAEMTFSLTKEDVFQEPFAYAGKPSEQKDQLKKNFNQRRLKDKYATPRSRMQMLWARVVSDAVRTVCPEANQGHYTPEEVEDFTPDENPSHQNDQPKPLQQEPAEEMTVQFCPIPGPMLGRKWADMDEETLKKALNIKHETMTDAHYTEIKKQIQLKEDENDDNKS